MNNWIYAYLSHIRKPILDLFLCKSTFSTERNFIRVFEVGVLDML